jgi:hypothetical protein
LSLFRAKLKFVLRGYFEPVTFESMQSTVEKVQYEDECRLAQDDALDEC